jgi:hypothetical protein
MVGQNKTTHHYQNDGNKQNIGLSSKYYFTDDLNLSFKYVKQTFYKSGIKYYSLKGETYSEESITTSAQFDKKIDDLKTASKEKEKYLYVRICTND